MLSVNQLTMLREKCGDDALYSDILEIMQMVDKPAQSAPENKAFYQIFRNSPDAMIISSLETGCYIDVNDSFERHIGYRRHELIGRTSLELSVWAHTEDRDRFVEQLKQDGYVSNFEAPYRRKDGSIGIGLVSSQFITLNNEQCLVSITRDITDYKYAQRMLTLAEERNAIYHEVLTNASHEFRTPLSVINTSIYVAKNAENKEKQQTFLNKIKQQTALLDQLINNILLLARLDSEDAYASDVISIRTLLSDVKSIIKSHADEFGVKISLHIEDGLPELKASSEYLTIAIHELVRNAIDHSYENSTVFIRACLRDDNVIIDVIDTGTGIDDEVLPYIFDRFYRGNPARTTRGFGLGLPIAQKIAEYYGCGISVASTPLNGSHFQIAFPSHLHTSLP